jgi:hypothetical protein
VVLLFLVPVLFFSYEREILMQGYVQSQVIYFTDCIRNTGYISENTYKEFKRQLAVSKHVYEIEMAVYETYKNTGTKESFVFGTYTDSILETVLNKKSWYILHQGDFLRVSVRRKDKTLLERMLHVLTIGRKEVENIPLQYGGMVRDECF